MNLIKTIRHHLANCLDRLEHLDHLDCLDSLEHLDPLALLCQYAPSLKGGRGESPLLLFLLLLLPSCSDWNTDTLGSSFTPANSVVRVYNNLVFVEYTAEKPRVWGPASDDISYTNEGNHLSIQSDAQNVAYFVYGYAASDTLNVSESSLSIQSKASYALYLEGVSLRSQDRPVFQSPGNDECHIVLSTNSVNHLYGAVKVGGNMSLSGTGTLTIDCDSTCITAGREQVHAHDREDKETDGEGGNVAQQDNQVLPFTLDIAFHFVF